MGIPIQVSVLRADGTPIQTREEANAALAGSEYAISDMIDAGVFFIDADDEEDAEWHLTEYGETGKPIKLKNGCQIEIPMP